MFALGPETVRLHCEWEDSGGHAEGQSNLCKRSQMLNVRNGRSSTVSSDGRDSKRNERRIGVHHKEETTELAVAAASQRFQRFQRFQRSEGFLAGGTLDSLGLKLLCLPLAGGRGGNGVQSAFTLVNKVEKDFK